MSEHNPSHELTDPSDAITEPSEAEALRGWVNSQLHTMKHDLEGYRDGIIAKFGKAEADKEFDEWNTDFESIAHEVAIKNPEDKQVVVAHLRAVESAMHDYFRRRLGLTPLRRKD